MNDERRKRSIRYATREIERTGHAVCVCGQMFQTEDGYAEHVATCEHVERIRAVTAE